MIQSFRQYVETNDERLMPGQNIQNKTQNVITQINQQIAALEAQIKELSAPLQAQIKELTAKKQRIGTSMGGMPEPTGYGGYKGSSWDKPFGPSFQNTTMYLLNILADSKHQTLDPNH